MTNEERLLHALYGIKKVLNDFGLEDIKNEVQFKDGNSETIDCINVLQEFVVNYVNNTQAYKKEDCMYLYHDKNKKVFIDELGANEFEENRFYPVIIGGKG